MTELRVTEVNILQVRACHTFEQLEVLSHEIFCNLSAYVRNGETTRTHSSLCSWAGVSEQSLTMCSSDFVFRKYKQDSAFRVSGVLRLAKTGPPVTKNFHPRRLFPSDAMVA